MNYSTSSVVDYSSPTRSPLRGDGKEFDDKEYVYKKSSYQYSSSGKENNSFLDASVDQNIDQLDALLKDLKTERQITRERNVLLSSSDYKNKDWKLSELAEPVTNTTRVIKTSTRQIDEPVFEYIENIADSDYNNSRNHGYSTLQNSLRRSEYQVQKTTHGSNKHVEKSNESEIKMYGNKPRVENYVLLPSANTSTAEPLSKHLHNVDLADGILPLPGTKVTTTVRTYTYEVPGVISTDVNSHINQLQNNTTYKAAQYNETTKEVQPVLPVVPQTVIYNTESHLSTNRNEVPILSKQTYEIRELRETNDVSNYPPPHLRKPNVDTKRGNTKIDVYNVNNTENVYTVPEGYRTPHNSLIPQKPTVGHSNRDLPPIVNTNTYIYKESSNIASTIQESGPEPNLSHLHSAPIRSPHKLSPPTYQHSDDGYSPNSQPNRPSVIYRHTTTSTKPYNEVKYGTTSPFPVVDYPVMNGAPPQKVDDLMQSFKNADAVDKSDIKSSYRKREIETAVAVPTTPNIATVNRAGKEVYYPPGHDTMLTKHEQFASGSSASGRWAKGSGMYEYESGYKSKTKTKSGGAMVPVCLPLCCAMPCTIM